MLLVVKDCQLYSKLLYTLWIEHDKRNSVKLEEIMVILVKVESIKDNLILWFKQIGHLIHGRLKSKTMIAKLSGILHYEVISVFFLYDKLWICVRVDQ